MERREAVKYIGILLGGSVVGANAFLTGCKTSGKKEDVSEERVAFLNEVGETILPATSTPGAKAANVGQFMVVMVNDCYEADDQEVFWKGIDDINDRSKKKFDKVFLEITPQQRTQLLTELDNTAKETQQKKREFDAVENEKALKEMTAGNKDYKKKEMPPHYFTMMKQLTLLGYFTSEIGHTQARRYEPAPGRYEGCVPYTKGEKAWA